jgi:hypothetical protein
MLVAALAKLIGILVVSMDAIGTISRRGRTFVYGADTKNCELTKAATSELDPAPSWLLSLHNPIGGLVHIDMVSLVCDAALS